MLRTSKVGFYDAALIEKLELPLDTLQDTLEQRLHMLEKPLERYATFCESDDMPMGYPKMSDTISFFMCAALCGGSGHGPLAVEARARWWDAECALARIQFARASITRLRQWLDVYLPEMKQFQRLQMPPAAAAYPTHEGRIAGIELLRTMDKSAWTPAAHIMYRIMLYEAADDTPRPLETCYVMVPFESALTLIGNKRAYMQGGVAYVGERALAESFLMTHFKKLYNPARSAFGLWSRRRLTEWPPAEVRRLRDATRLVSSRFLRSQPESVISSMARFNAEGEVCNLTPFSVAPCAAVFMRRLRESQQQTDKLGDAERKALANYTKNFVTTPEQHANQLHALYRTSMHKWYGRRADKELLDVRGLAKWVMKKEVLHLQFACAQKMCGVCPWGTDHLGSARQILQLMQAAGFTDPADEAGMLVESNRILSLSQRQFGGPSDPKRAACHQFMNSLVDRKLKQHKTTARALDFSGGHKIGRPIDYTRNLMDLEEKIAAAAQPPPPPPPPPTTGEVKIHERDRKRVKGSA